METNIPSSSSSSSSQRRRPEKFDVFLSFRGEDTRYNFTSHLSSALFDVGLISIFKEDKKLEAGIDMWPQLKNAIKNSKYAVVVLSENYATSTWCLRELANIVKRAGNESIKIRTIFYHVEPSVVRNVKSEDKRKQKGSFWDAMEAHKQNPSNSENTLEKWRKALFTVASQPGYPVSKAHTDEENFIKVFVAGISSELGASIRTMEDLFGMTSRLEKVDSYILQSLRTNDVCFIGIHGIGGIGKSTLAEEYKIKESKNFEGISFLANIRENSKKSNGLFGLQERLLKDILKEDIALGHVRNGMHFIKSRLHFKKVLIILDDVNNSDQLEALADSHTWFGQGSVIIVTTRHENLLIRKGYTKYRLEYLNDKEALQLFSWKAFTSIEPLEGYEELSKEVVKYAGNLPLVLRVWGSHLGSKDINLWKDALSDLRKCQDNEIVEKLKISFVDLNEDDQCIFLDIACFFKGYNEYEVEEILDSCGVKSKYRINNLIDKSLLSINQYGEIWMHDLLQEMGKGIVQKDSGKELRRQSRIWDMFDLCRLLENDEGTNEVLVEAIVTYCDATMKYNFEALSSMRKLRLLMIRMVFPLKCYEPDDLSGYKEESVSQLSKKLQYIEWSGFPYNKLPSSFQPLQLVHLKLRGSHIEQLWNNDTKPLSNLKVMDLSYSLSFTKFENFTVVPNLETLILLYCEKLSEIHPSIKNLKKLILLDLQFCTSLKKLPEEIIGVTSLQTLKLSRCHKLEKLPDNFDQLKSLRNLEVEDSGINHLPPSIFLMGSLELVYCNHEMIESAIRENIISYRRADDKCFLPGSFCTGHRALERLNLIDCNLPGPEAFPKYFGKLVSLRYINLSKNPFSVLPHGINGLSSLTALRLEHCKSLRCLEPQFLPSSLEEVNVNYCTSLASFLDPLKPCHLRCSAQCLDCTELVKRQDGKMTALASLSRFLDQDPSKRRFKVFKFVVPQSDNKLPSWFINQSSTASISIEVDPNWRNSELIGLAMVFCFRANSSTENNFCCKVRVRGSKNWGTTKEVGVIDSRMSDHLFLFYSPCEEIGLYMKQLEPPSGDTIEFSFVSAYDKHCSSCGPCGVRLVYEEDIKELKELTSISQLTKPSHMGPFGPPLWTGLRGILDLKDNLEFLEMKPYSHDQDPPNPESNTSGIIAKFLKK